MMVEFVRSAGETDVGVLTELEDEARAALGEVARGGPQWLETHGRIGAIGWQVRLADPGWSTLVAGLDGVVLAAASMRLPVGRRRQVAEVEGIFVTPLAREVGLGEMLLTSLVETAGSAGAREIDATALPGDRETKNLFERFGLVARLIVVSRRLEQ